MRKSHLIFGMMLLACPPQQQPEVRQDIVATINEVVITKKDVKKRLIREVQRMEGLEPRNHEQIKPFKQVLLNTLIEQTLLLQAARAAGVSVSMEEVNKQIRSLTRAYPFDEALEHAHMTRTALTHAIQKQLIIEKLLAHEVFSRVAVTEAQIRRYFDEHPKEFEEPEQVHAFHILVKDLDKAKRMQRQLRRKKGLFAGLARQHSLSPDAKVGGDLGFFARGQMPTAFDEVVFNLPLHATSNILSTEYGFHLFQVLEKIPARRRKFTQMREKIEKKLLRQFKMQAQEKYIADLRNKATITVHMHTLQQITGYMAADNP